jgi:drug/metabolite transporter (DMT)-like permease
MGAFLLVLMAGLVKHLGDSLPVPVIVFVRFLAGFLVLMPVIWRMGFRVLKTSRLPLHLTRGCVGLGGNLALFFALVHLTIADTITIQFSRPLIMLIIATVFLAERPRPKRLVVTVLGFCGIVMITRPFGGGFDPWTLVALSGAVFATLVALCIKFLARTEPTMVIMFYFALVTTTLSSIPAIIFWETPTLLEFGLLAITGTLGIAGQSLFTHGLATGETSFVLPFDYLRSLYAFTLGVIIFAELPPAWSRAGAATIILSSIYLLRTEQKEARKAALSTSRSGN